MSHRLTHCAADRRAHDRAWAPERARRADGLTHFQHRLEAALHDAGYRIVDRTVAPIRGGEPGDLYVTGRVDPPAVRIYVYADGVEVEAAPDPLRLERRDGAHPDAMVRTLVDRLDALAARDPSRPRR